MLTALFVALPFVLAFVLAALLLWLKKAPKTAALLMFTAGAGASGWAGGLIGTAMGVAGATVGFGVGAILILVSGVIFVHDLWPKHKAQMRTAAAGFLLPIFTVGSGGAIAKLVGAAGDGAGKAATATTNTLFGSIGTFKGWW